MKPLEKFIQNNRAKSERSKIWPFRAEIFKLAELDYSTYQIATFLNSKFKKEDEKVTHTTVFYFLKKHKKLKTKEKTTYVEVKTPVIASVANTYNKNIKTEKAVEPKAPLYTVKMDDSHPSVQKWKKEELKLQGKKQND